MNASEKNVKALRRCCVFPRPCRTSMKPDWDKLGQQYGDSSSVMIVDVDCTVEEKTCSKMGAEAMYPKP